MSISFADKLSILTPFEKRGMLQAKCPVYGGLSRLLQWYMYNNKDLASKIKDSGRNLEPRLSPSERVNEPGQKIGLEPVYCGTRGWTTRVHACRIDLKGN